MTTTSTTAMEPATPAISAVEPAAVRSSVDPSSTVMAASVAAAQPVHRNADAGVDAEASRASPTSHDRDVREYAEGNEGGADKDFEDHLGSVLLVTSSS